MKKQGYEPDTRHVHPRVTYFSPPSEVTHPRNITEPGGYEAVKKNMTSAPVIEFQQKALQKKPRLIQAKARTLLSSDLTKFRRKTRHYLPKPTTSKGSNMEFCP